MASRWLLKTEPHTYGFDRLLKEGKTNWDGVRNFQARNYLRQVSRGDLVIIYHSGDEKSAVGVAQVIREAYPDPDPEKAGDWVQIDLKPVEKFVRAVTLQEIKRTPALSGLPLIRQSQLSCMPVSVEAFEILARMGGIRSGTPGERPGGKP